MDGDQINLHEASENGTVNTVQGKVTKYDDNKLEEEKQRYSSPNKIEVQERE